MEQLIEAFGIDIKLITVQIINFAVLVVVLSYFLYGPILRTLKERREVIVRGLADAKAAEDARTVADAEKAVVLQAAHQEATAVAARAKAYAEEKAAAEIAAAEAKGTNIIAAAETRATEMKAQALKESDAEITKLALLATEKLLRRGGQ